MKRRFKKIIILFMTACMCIVGTQTVLPVRASVSTVTSGDAYVSFDNSTQEWDIGTDSIEMKVRFDSSTGKLNLTSLYNKLSSKEYKGSADSAEFSFKIGGNTYTGTTGGYTYDSYSTDKLTDGSIRLTITMHTNTFQIMNYYTVFPDTGVIKRGYDIKNTSVSSFTVSDMYYCYYGGIFKDDVDNIDFHYFGGGTHSRGVERYENSGDGNSIAEYKRYKNSMSSSYTKTIDSKGDPMPKSQWDYHGYGKYAPYWLFEDTVNNEGLFIGLEYGGYWNGYVGNFQGDPIDIRAKVASMNETVENNSIINSPESFIGVYKGDTDDAGDAVVQLQYKYYWDKNNTNYPLFFMNSLGEEISNNTEQGMMNNAKEIMKAGFDVYAIDCFWYDKLGDWIEPSNEFPNTLRYVEEYMTEQGITYGRYFPWYDADSDSDAYINHSEWYRDNAHGFQKGYGDKFACQSDPDFRSWIKGRMDEMMNRYHRNFSTNGYYKYDSCVINPGCTDTSHGHSVGNNGFEAFFRQWYGFIDVLEYIKSTYPDVYFMNCANGGEVAGFDTLRYSESFNCSDYNKNVEGARSIIYNYSYIFPAGMGERGLWSDITSSNASSITNSWMKYAIRSLMMASFAGMEIENYKALSQENKDIITHHRDIHKYLRDEGVIGRYSHSYQPLETLPHNDKWDGMEFLNSNKTKGAFFLFRGQSNTESSKTIKPTKLIEDHNYTVTFEDGGGTSATNTGSYWMTNGITVSIPEQKGSEIVYFNLADVPGMASDSVAPSAPTSVVKQPYISPQGSGAKISWTEASDNKYVIGYNIYKNGVKVGTTRIGTTYIFTSKVDSNDIIQVSAFDENENESSKTTASGNMLKYIASRDYSGAQGINNWYYQEWDGSTYNNMSWSRDKGWWHGSYQYCDIFGPGKLSPHTNDAVLAWKAPVSGTVEVTGTVKKHDITGGDGVKVKIMKESTQLWPEIDYQNIAFNDTTGYNHDLTIDVSAGETIYFIVNMNGDTDYDGTNWDPTVEYTSVKSASYTAAYDFSDTQGYRNWYYMESSDSGYNKMIWDLEDLRWEGLNKYNLIWAPSQMHPDSNDTVLAWEAPTAGAVSIKGNLSKMYAGGDGVNVKILLNDRQLWPTSGWQYIGSNDRTSYDHNVIANVILHDTIYFVVNQNQGFDYDEITWNPSIEYLDSLNSEWKLDENTGTITYDSTNNNNGGTLINSPNWVLGHKDYALDFDGNNSYVNIPNSTSLENIQEGSYTLSAWFKADTVPPGTGEANDAHYAIIMKEGYHEGLYYTNEQKIEFAHWLTGDNDVIATTTDTFSTGTWYHVVGVVDRKGGIVELYVNGTLQASENFIPETATREYDQETWKIGIADPDESTYRWCMDGSIDEVRIYNYALSDTQVQSLYNLY